VRARQAVQHWRYGEAIAHYLSAGDDAMVVQLADQLLDEYLTHGASGRSLAALCNAATYCANA